RAVAIDPQSAFAQKTLGWILQHDLLGRRFRAGFDWAAAVAAYRKAKALDGDDHETRADLAILLEHDADGERYSRRAKLGEAIAEYQSLRKEKEETGFDANLMMALLWAGRFSELKQLAKSLPQEPTRNAALLAAVAAAEGEKRALYEAAG